MKLSNYFRHLFLRSFLLSSCSLCSTSVFFKKKPPPYRNIWFPLIWRKSQKINLKNFLWVTPSSHRQATISLRVLNAGILLLHSHFASSLSSPPLPREGFVVEIWFVGWTIHWLCVMRFVDGCDKSGVVSHANGRGEETLTYFSEHPFRVMGKVLSGKFCGRDLVSWFHFPLVMCYEICRLLWYEWDCKSREREGREEV